MGDAALHRLSERFGLAGKTAIVTGGTKGIGHAVVEELCVLGCTVLTCARNKEDLDKCIDEWRAKGYQVLGMAVDCSDSAGRQLLLQGASTAFGDTGLDILVNNVGTNIRKPTVDYTEDEVGKVMSTNLDSAFFVSQMCHKLLRQAKGSVVFVSSVAGGPLAMKSGTPYAMSKAAMNQLTRNLAVEWAGDGVRVNCVAPWYTATPLAMQVLQNEQYKDAVLSRTPMGRIATPEEVASCVAFLCGKGAGFVTGQVLSIDGGYSCMGFF
ncbi:unnamed protein product [Pedinophyceae sp. YPF-701]|nr:unnamed protein product [Pedinophyceae sp. YPF-701]